MEKYITSDKIGQFVQALYESGKFSYIQVEGKQISVRKEDGDYIFIQVFNKMSFDELVKGVTEEA